METARRADAPAATLGPAVAEQRAADPPRPLDLKQVLAVVGSPVALATALLFYFGWVRSEAQARAFGADASVFAMSTQDYVLRSVNVLFFPVILLLLLALAVLRLDRAVRARPVPPAWLGPVSGVVRWSWALFLPLGVALVVVAGRFGDVTLPLWVGLAIVAPAYGSVLGRRARGDTSRFPAGTFALLATLVTVTLFWQTERLARLGGEALADDIKGNLTERLERVELFSAEDLGIAAPTVSRTALPGADAAYAYRYSGFFLLQRSGDKYFLLTEGWDEGNGRLVVLPDSNSIRLEFGG